jgi:uncharacterized repeat protein (TIGR01451 family)
MSTGQGQVESHTKTTARARAAWSTALPLMALVGLCCFVAGCHQLNVPRIDPFGQSIFLPCPNTTQLTLPHVHATPDNPGIFQPQAFPTPADPPPCLNAPGPEEKGVCNLFHHNLVSHVHDHFSHQGPGAAGEIQLSPLRIVAPVCGEVVLLAGICGKDGHLLKREPLEWMLSPDSVGQIIEVGDDTKGRLIGSLRHGPRVEKLDVDFARGRTSSRATTITRGTATCDDDIKLKEGQTWLSLSSPTEGVSRVTVLAPDSEIWDRRRRTATIYWVDAQWQFPEPSVARSGETITLVTRVTRAENLVPAEGWRVRYTILDPNVAAFIPPIGTNIAVVQVDANGMATVQLAAPSGVRGTTPVFIEIIRPAQPSDNLPELVLGRGQTMVSFSSPGLELSSAGPPAATIGDRLTYTASLGNPGDLDAENVRLIARLPAGTRLLEAVPQPTQIVNGGAVWDQGVLSARRQLDVALTLAVEQPGTFDFAFVAEGAGGLAATSSVQTQVAQPSVGVRFEPAGGVAQAAVGQTIEYEIEVTNTGRQTLTDLRVIVESDPGLQEISQSSNRVEQRIPVLAPGQPVRFGVAFVVRQEGRLTARLRVLSVGDAVLGEREVSIIGQPPRAREPRMDLAITFPPTVPVGQTTQALLQLRNAGETPLTNIVVNISSDEALQAVEADRDNLSRIQVSGTRLTWRAPDLQPGQFAQVYLGYSPRIAAEQARISVEAVTAEGARGANQVATRIVSGSGGTVMPPAESSPAVRAGDWSISIVDLHDPVVVGGRVRYVLTIVNNQNLPDRQVRVQITRPEGARIESISRGGSELAPSFAPDSLWIDLPVEQFVRPGERLEYLFVVVPTIPQTLRLSARVSSEAQPTPREVTETTTVNAR